MMCEVLLASGSLIQVWRSADGQQYFCHGLTFGGKGAPGGAVSPYTGWSVETILRECYELVPEELAAPGDILVWKGVAPETTPHSAILTQPIVHPGEDQLGVTSRLQTKNGLSPETNMPLQRLIAIYGESYNAYRRRSP